MASVYVRSAGGGVDLLTKVLPAEITARLDANIVAAVGAAESIAR